MTLRVARRMRLELTASRIQRIRYALQHLMPPFYHPGRPEALSQGDILRDVPWGLIPPPLTVCRSKKSPPDVQGQAWYAPAEQWSQGGAAFTKGRAESVHAKAQSGLAMVVWEDCEIDRFAKAGKPESKWYAAVAPVVPAGELAEAERASVAAGRRRRFFPLPEDAAAGIERPSYVDLRLIWSVQHSLLTGRRVASLSDSARLALRDQLFAFFTKHWLPDAVTCETCGTDVAVKPKLIVAGDD